MTRPWSLTLPAVLSACVAGCSHSSSPAPPAAPPSTTIASDQTTALQAIVANASNDAGVPVDDETAKVAAQMSYLNVDRVSSVFAANALQVSEQDPSNAAIASQLEVYRQKELAQAAADGQQMQDLQAKTSAPGKGFLGNDGGADQVLSTLVAKAFAAQAVAYLAAGTKAATSGGGAPSADDITSFLQTEAIATADEGAGGHDVAGRYVASRLVNDASVASILAVDGGTP